MLLVRVRRRRWRFEDELEALRDVFLLLVTGRAGRLAAEERGIEARRLLPRATSHPGLGTEGISFNACQHVSMQDRFKINK